MDGTGDERGERDDLPERREGEGVNPSWGEVEGEVDGLGLTEEFSRIENEIEAERGPPGESEPIVEPKSAPEPAADSTPEPPAASEPPAATEPPAASDSEPAHPPATSDSEPARPPASAVPESEESERRPEPVAASTPQPPPRPRPVATPSRTAASNRLAALAASIPEKELEDKTPSLWLRFLSGSMLVVSSVAGAVAIAGIIFFSEIADGLRPIPGIQAQLAAIEPDDPQTIMIVGSDLRADDERGKNGALSDTTMLLRIDPEKDVLSLFSLPRDLKVNIPGVGTNKLNEAYANGGIKKTLKTVKEFTGLEINHAVEINFAGFAQAVDAIGCVYIDVDRKYFNDNSTAAPGEEYAEIDINSGYQKLCGLKALQYVRYRHTDTDLVRAARQQDFLREARARVDPKQLAAAVLGVSGQGTKLIDVFTSNTNSDINDDSQIVGLLKSFAAMIDVPVNEVHFEGDIGGLNSTFVTATDKEVEKAIDQFLNGVGTEGQRGGEEATEEKDGGSKKKKTKDKQKAPDAEVVDTSSLGDTTGKLTTLADRFQKDAEKNKRRLGIPIFYPSEVVPGSTFSTDSRTSSYDNEEGKKEEEYKTVIPYETPSTLTEYYGVVGTTWDDPPILRNPSEDRTYDGREYELFYDGDRLRMIGWHEDGNSYWLNNTLSQSLGEAEMIAIATSMKEI